MLYKEKASISPHLRPYILGDIDVKDIPIRMIIYGKKEIENWSHYIVAKEMGYDLPENSIPTPKDI